MRYLTSIFLAGLMLLVVGCGDSTTDTEQVATPSATQESVALTEAGVVSLSQIQSDFSSNSVTAKLKYEDQNLTISGEIYHIEAATDSRTNKSLANITVGLTEEDLKVSGKFSWIYCEVAQLDILTLEIGDFIIVNGVFSTESPRAERTSGDDYGLDGCSIVTDRYISE